MPLGSCVRNQEPASSTLHDFIGNRAVQPGKSPQKAAAELEERVGDASPVAVVDDNLSAADRAPALANSTREITLKVALQLYRKSMAKSLSSCMRELERLDTAPHEPRRYARCVELLKELASEIRAYFEETINNCKDEAADDPF